MKRLSAALLTLALLLTLVTAALGEESGPFAMAGYEGSSGRSWESSKYFKRMADRTGVSFTFQPFYDYTKYSRWKSALDPKSELPDVLFKASLSDGEARTLFDRGVLIDLKPYISEEVMPNLCAMLKDQPALWTEMTLEGHVITLPVIDSLQLNDALWINIKWLEALKMEMPTTAEELTAVLRAFKTRDPNMNGRADEIPLTFTGLWELRFLQHAFGLNMNDYYLTADAEGTVTAPITSDQNRAFLAWLHTLWDEGLIDHGGLLTPDSMRQVTDSKNVPYGIVFGPAWSNTIMPAEVSGDYKVLMPLQYNGTQTYRSLLGQLTRGCFAVTSACRDPETVLRWADDLYSRDGCFLARCGEQDKEYRLNEDGLWQWLAATENLNRDVILPATIDGGANLHGYIHPDYWLRFDDESIRGEKEQMAELAAIATEPCPQVMLTADEAQRLADRWPQIGVYAETQMTHFVTGDVPLNDETWADFCAQIQALGMDEVVALSQGALDREGGAQ